MLVYIVIDDCPQDFGEKSIQRVFDNPDRAKEYVSNRKRQYPYECQYYRIEAHTVQKLDVNNATDSN